MGKIYCINQKIYKRFLLYFWNTINLNNITFKIPRDMFFSVIPNFDFHEKNVIFWFEKIISKHKIRPVFYDIGANFGYYSVKNANDLKQIYSFEPVMKTYSILRDNISKNKLHNIKAYRVALSNSSGKDFINLYSSCGNNSMFRRSIPDNITLNFLGRGKNCKIHA